MFRVLLFVAGLNNSLQSANCYCLSLTGERPDGNELTQENITTRKGRNIYHVGRQLIIRVGSEQSDTLPIVVRPPAQQHPQCNTHEWNDGRQKKNLHKKIIELFQNQLPKRLSCQHHTSSSSSKRNANWSLILPSHFAHAVTGSRSIF